MNPIDILAKEIMLPIIGFFFGLTHSYGWSIVLLTVTVRMAMLPLTASQFKSAKTMQRLQPKLQEVQKRYKDKPEEMQKQLMLFYKEHNYNPFSSCLPVLIQMPFLFALYATLISETFKHTIAGQGFLFIQDLARVGMNSASGLHWDSIVMLLLFGGTTFVTQKMMTTNPDDPTQKQMLVTMPLMITVMFAFFPVPAGVLLYIVASNFITLGQNYFLLQWSPALHTPIDAIEQVGEVKKEETKKEEPKNPNTRKKGK
ncbi:MAG TPA: hypothetical protein DD435_15950 [Cyanobacteria bacterium UBA8530]|nr:hypothetical protein [Cyanobacteria bacterium UBA8530]